MRFSWLIIGNLANCRWCQLPRVFPAFYSCLALFLKWTKSYMVLMDVPGFKQKTSPKREPITNPIPLKYHFLQANWFSLLAFLTVSCDPNNPYCQYQIGFLASTKKREKNRDSRQSQVIFRNPSDNWIHDVISLFWKINNCWGCLVTV